VRSLLLEMRKGLRGVGIEALVLIVVALLAWLVAAVVLALV
jgi:hypothetical protein